MLIQSRKAEADVAVFIEVRSDHSNELTERVPLPYDLRPGDAALFDRDHEADLDEWEYPDASDDDGMDETIPCPYCEKPIYEEAERCLFCGHYISIEDAPRRYSWWFILGFLLSMVVVLGWVFH